MWKCSKCLKQNSAPLHHNKHLQNSWHQHVLNVNEITTVTVMFKVRTPRYLQQPADAALFTTTSYVWGRHFTHIWKSLAWANHFSKSVILVHKISSTPPLFIEKPVSYSHVYVWYWYRLCLCFYHFSIRLWNCSDSLVMLFYLSYYFTLWNCSDSLVMLFYLSYYFTLSAYQMRMIGYS